jgi:hypothetical protein
MLCYNKELFPVIFAASNKSSHSIYFKLGDKGMVSITNFHLGHDGKAAQKAIYDGIIENRRHKCLFRVVCGDFNFSSNKFAEASIINGFGVRPSESTAPTCQTMTKAGVHSSRLDAIFTNLVFDEYGVTNVDAVSEWSLGVQGGHLHSVVWATLQLRCIQEPTTPPICRRYNIAKAEQRYAFSARVAELLSHRELSDNSTDAALLLQFNKPQLYYRTSRIIVVRWIIPYNVLRT